MFYVELGGLHKTLCPEVLLKYWCARHYIYLLCKHLLAQLSYLSREVICLTQCLLLLFPALLTQVSAVLKSFAVFAMSEKLLNGVVKVHAVEIPFRQNSQNNTEWGVCVFFLPFFLCVSVIKEPSRTLKFTEELQWSTRILSTNSWCPVLKGVLGGSQILNYS